MKKRFRKRCPYLMLQPTLADAKECKVVLLDGAAVYMHRPKKKGSGRKFANDTAIFSFAEESLHMLSLKLPGTISNMLVRVDVMCLADGRFVVNEFESFEAAYWGSKETATSEFLIRFWQQIIADVAFKFLN